MNSQQPMEMDMHPKNYKSMNPTYSVECIDEFSRDCRDDSFALGGANKVYLYEELIGKRMSKDLTEGFGNWVPKEHNNKLDKALAYLMEVSSPGCSLKEATQGCEFVSRRGPLSRLAISPYEAEIALSDRDVGIKVGVTKHKGVYFLSEFKTDKKHNNEAGQSDYVQRAVYGGFKFEQLMTTKHPKGRPDADEVVDPNSEYNGVFKALLRAEGTAIRILCCAEVDCESPSTHELVELKTQYRSLGHGNGFEMKALKWYMQSFLVGIKQFAIGFHERLRLNRVELHSVESVRQMCHKWNPRVCLAFLHKLLAKLKQELDALEEGAILVAERVAGARTFNFTVVGLDDEEGQKQYAVITDRFKAFDWK